MVGNSAFVSFVKQIDYAMYPNLLFVKVSGSNKHLIVAILSKIILMPTTKKEPLQIQITFHNSFTDPKPKNLVHSFSLRRKSESKSTNISPGNSL